MSRRLTALVQRFMAETAQRQFEEEVRIEVVLSEQLLEQLTVSLEGTDWQESNVKDLCFRVDPPNPEQKQQRHVHIAHKKHTTSSARKEQVAWNENGTRHDKKNFNAKLASKRAVRELAIKALGLPATASLESEGGEANSIGEPDVTELGPMSYRVDW
ncbi:MAG: DUF6367 family protein [Rhodanobacter sp.]